MTCSGCSMVGCLISHRGFCDQAYWSLIDRGSPLQQEWAPWFAVTASASIHLSRLDASRVSLALQGGTMAKTRGDPASSGGADLETTASLVERIRNGDPAAREILTVRFLPALRRWACGRVPARAHDLNDTDDLVQNTIMKALDHVEDFEPRHKGSFLAFLRTILLNEIRDALRKFQSKPTKVPLNDCHPDPGPSPLETAIGRELLEKYDAALAESPGRKQEALMLRIEMHCSYSRIALDLGFNTESAARMYVSRALANLADLMNG